MLRILLLSLLVGNFAFAEEGNEKKKKDIYANKGNIDVGVAKSSSVNRRDKIVAINVGAGYEAVTATFSLGLAYIIDEHLLIDLRASKGENNTTTETKEFDSFSLGVKFFSSESFYIRPAFEYMKVIDFDNSTSDEARGGGISFTVGNQWQYRNFSIGVDWIGVKHIISASQISDDAERTYLSLAGFYVGTTF